MNFIKLDRTETIRLLITGVLMKLRERAGECSEKKEERRGGYVLRASRKGAASAHKIASVSNLLATWACFLAYMTHVYTRVRVLVYSISRLWWPDWFINFSRLKEGFLFLRRYTIPVYESILIDSITRDCYGNSGAGTRGVTRNFWFVSAEEPTNIDRVKRFVNRNDQRETRGPGSWTRRRDVWPPVTPAYHSSVLNYLNPIEPGWSAIS